MLLGNTDTDQNTGNLNIGIHYNKVLFENNYTTVELNIFVTMQLRANLRVPTEHP